MTVGLLFIWDEGWFHPNMEVTLWHDLALAYSVDLLIMIPDLKRYNYQDINFVKYDDVETALDNHSDLTFVFLEPKNIADSANVPSESLSSFDHPKDALYIFGNSGRNNIGLYDQSRGDKVVYVPTIKQDQQIWSIEVASIVLYDRAKKAWVI